MLAYVVAVRSPISYRIFQDRYLCELTCVEFLVLSMLEDIIIHSLDIRSLFTEPMPSPKGEISSVAKRDLFWAKSGFSGPKTFSSDLRVMVIDSEWRAVTTLRSGSLPLPIESLGR